MSVPRVLLAPTHRTGLAGAVAAAIAEIVGRQERQVRFHHLGVSGPAEAWDRWEGSSFLDPSLYDRETLLRLYELTTRGADLSLLASTRGLFDTREGAPWTPADVARDARLPRSCWWSTAAAGARASPASSRGSTNSDAMCNCRASC